MFIFDLLKDSHKETAAKGETTDAAHDELHQDMRQKMVMYGVTNRKVDTDGKSFVDDRWSPPLDTAVHYFKQAVNVAGDSGNFHTVMTAAPELIDKSEFDKGVAAEVKAANGKLGIFLHGIRTASGEAGSTAAELTAATGEPFVIEDWASTKSAGFLAARQERLDDRASYQSQGMIDSSVEELTQKFGAKNIDMVAHSRGSMNQIRALADLQNRDMGAVHSATFAHSDVDLSDFELSLGSFQNAAKHVNVVYNPDDGALRLSELRRFGQIARLDDNNQNAVEQSARLGRVGLPAGEIGASNSFLASKVPNYFSIAKDGFNDRIGHAFAPSLVASMIASPDSYKSFSTLKSPSSLEKTDCPLSPASSFAHVISSFPYIPFRTISAERARTDIVSDSPEVQKYMTAANATSFGFMAPVTAEL